MRTSHVVMGCALVAMAMAMPYTTTEESIVPEVELVTGDGGDTVAAIEAKVAAKSKAADEIAEAKGPSEEDKAEQKIAEGAKVAADVIAATLIVKNDVSHLEASLKNTPRKSTAKVLQTSQLALAKCKALKTKVYEDCRAASCSYNQKCGSKRAATTCLADEAEYKQEKKAQEVAFKKAEKAAHDKELKHKAWEAGKSERKVKAEEKKKKWDANAPFREKGDKNFERIMGMSQKAAEKKAKDELHEEAVKAKAKRDAQWEKDRAEDEAAKARFEQKHGKTSLLQGDDWADHLIPKLLAGRRLLKADDISMPKGKNGMPTQDVSDVDEFDDDEHTLNSAAEKKKLESERTTKELNEKRDLKKAHSEACVAEDKKQMASCAALVKYADDSCEAQLKAAEGNFDHWLNPDTGSSIAGEEAKAKAASEAAHVFKKAEEEIKKESKATKATKVADAAEHATEEVTKKTGSKLEEAAVASDAGDKVGATKKAEQALDSSAEVAAATEKETEKKEDAEKEKAEEKKDVAEVGGDAFSPFTELVQ